MTTETTHRDRERHEEQSLEEMREGRQYLKYTFYKLLPSWRASPEKERDEARQDFLKVMSKYEDRMIVKSFSLIGTRGDSDFMLWTISERLEDFQDLLSEVLKSKLGRFIEPPYSYL